MKIGPATIANGLLCFVLGNQIPSPIPILVLACLLPVAFLAGIGAAWLDTRSAP